MLNATEIAAQHPAFQAAWHKVTLASDADKLRALQEAAIQLAPAIANGEIFKSDATYVLRVAARNGGLDSRFRPGDVESSNLNSRRSGWFNRCANSRDVRFPMELFEFEGGRRGGQRPPS